MKAKLITWLVGTILSRIDDEDVKGWLLAGIAMLRKKIVDTPWEWDDLLVLPLLDLVEAVVIGKRELSE